MHTITRCLPHALGALALALLAACGGGGSDSETPGSTGTADSGAVTDDSNGQASGTAGPVRSGEATFYGATGEGHCSFDASPQDLRVAAMNHADYANSAMCGAYVAVSGPKGKVTVRITDECPECPRGHIDLSESAFARIADPVAGRVPVTWQVVPGPVQGPVQYRYKEGSSIWWTAIQVRNHRRPITKLEIRPTGSSQWMAVKREPYNYFVYPSAIAAGALQVRITAEGGAVLVDTLPEPRGGLLVQGRAQFPG